MHLDTDRSLFLDRTVKDDEILSGHYGAVYAVKTCFYNRPLQSGYSTVAVGSYLNELGHEIPIELPAPPRNLPPLTSVSLVRIFRTDPEYVIVSANYEPDGRLGSLHVDKTKGGDWVSGASLLKSDPNKNPL